MKISKIGRPLLRKKIRFIPLKKIRRIKKEWVLNLVKTMRKHKGVGLAANQVEKKVPLILLEVRDKKRYPKAPKIPLKIYLNPRILDYSDSVVYDWEGCLSIPGYRGKVPRSKTILLDAWTLDGKNIREVVYGFEARILQHEIDHLNGLFYVDRMSHMKNWISVKE